MQLSSVTVTRLLGARPIRGLAALAAVAALAVAPAWSAPHEKRPKQREDRAKPFQPLTPAPAPVESSKPPEAEAPEPDAGNSKITPPPLPKPVPGIGQEVVIAKKFDLEFGRMVMVGSGGSVRLPARGLPTYTGLVPTGAGPTRARFMIRGPANRIIQLQLTFPLSGEYGLDGDATLDGLSVTADNPTGFKQDGTMVVVKLDSSGTNAITVGGTLTLSSAVVGKTAIFMPISAELVTR